MNLVKLYFETTFPDVSLSFITGALFPYFFTKRILTTSGPMVVSYD